MQSKVKCQVFLGNKTNNVAPKGVKGKGKQ